MNAEQDVMLEIHEDLQRILKSGPFVKWKGKSANELLAHLWDLVLHLDLGSLLVWEQLSPEANAQSSAAGHKGVSKSLAGKTEISPQEFRQALDRSKKFISDLRLAISGKRAEGFKGRIPQYAEDFESKFKTE